jgi:hypothetical protein
MGLAPGVSKTAVTARAGETMWDWSAGRCRPKQSRTKMATPAAVPPLAVTSAGAHTERQPRLRAQADAPATAACPIQVSWARTA